MTGKADPVVALLGSRRRAYSETIRKAARQGRRGQQGQGGRPPRHLAGGIGRRQRDHSPGHRTREGQEAGRRLDGRRRGERRTTSPAAAEKIYADPTTITGSIGVISGKLSATSKMWNQFGINFEPNQRGEKAGILSGGAKFTEVERKELQGWMDEVYGQFKKHVTDGRGDKLKKPIDEIAGGRVYTGRQAAGARPRR